MVVAFADVGGAATAPRTGTNGGGCYTPTRTITGTSSTATNGTIDANAKVLAAQASGRPKTVTVTRTVTRTKTVCRTTTVYSPTTVTVTEKQDPVTVITTVTATNVSETP